MKVTLQQRFDKKNCYLSALRDVEAKQLSFNKASTQQNKDKAAAKQVCVQFCFYCSLKLVLIVSDRLISVSDIVQPDSH